MTEGVCVLPHKHQPERPRTATEGHLCAGCAARLTTAISELPKLWDALEDVLAGEWDERVTDDRWPLAVAEHALPLKPAVAEHRRDIAQQLASWARMVAEEMGQHPPVPDVGRIATWLNDRQQWAYSQEWVDDYAREVLALRGRARALLDTGRRGWIYLGPCLTHAVGHGTCQVDVYAPEEADHVTCSGCGIQHQVAERREWLRREVGEMLATTAEVCGYAHTYAGVTIKEPTLRKWCERGRLQQHGKDEQGRGLYRVADVLELAAEHATRHVA